MTITRHWKSRVLGSTKNKKWKWYTKIKNSDKYNKPQEFLKGLNNCIWEIRLLSKRGSSKLSVDKIWLRQEQNVFVSVSKEKQPCNGVCVK